MTGSLSCSEGLQLIPQYMNDSYLNVVLVLAGIEIDFFIVAYMGQRSGFVLKTVLMTH